MADAVLKELYYTPGSPAAFGGAARLYRQARKRGVDTSLKKVKEWLLGQDTYTLHAPAKRKLTIQPRTYVPEIDDQWCADLADMSDLASENGDHRFILTVIDSYSKYAWVEPALRKSGPEITKAFAAILARTERRPKNLQTDQGLEFTNSLFQALLREERIKHFVTYSNHKAAIVERFNRSIKSLMYKYFTANRTNKWTGVLQDLLETYNTRRHRSIGMAPDKVTAANSAKVYAALYTSKGRMKPGLRLNRGDMVRINKYKGQFEKGYLPNYTMEVFKIADVRKPGYNTPYRYVLEDLAGESVQGTFVSQELQKVIKDPTGTWQIEKVISKRKRGRRTEFLVKWLGYADKFNSYVDEKELL